MFQSFRKSWSALRRSRPGQRFQAAYVRGAKYRSEAPLWKKVLVRIFGLGALVVGAFFTVFPGPGIPFLFLAAALFSRESSRLAVVLDWCEVKLRALFRPLHRWWKKSSGQRRVAMVTGCGVLLAVLGGGAYWYVRSSGTL
jgi:uncharacterized membrane protein YbaN (DUF454 family)